MTLLTRGTDLPPAHRAAGPTPAPGAVRRGQAARAAGLTAAALLLAGCSHFGKPKPQATPTTSPRPSAAPSAQASTTGRQAAQKLAGLVTAAPQPMAGYSRAQFPHWRSSRGECDTRVIVLKRDGANVQTSTDNCKIISGDWLSPYDNKRATVPTEMDIDHMVPLANAWRSGANTWDTPKRADFANDLTRPQLITVSASSNRAKGDQDPSQWKPPNQAYWCTYAESWIDVKSHWQLTVTEAERNALTEMLRTCQ